MFDVYPFGCCWCFHVLVAASFLRHRRRVCSKDKRRENSKSKFQEKKRKKYATSPSLSLFLKLGLSLNGAHVPASARSEIVRLGKRTSGVPRFGSSRSQKQGPSGTPHERSKSLNEKNTETAYRRRRRKDAHNRGEKPRRFSCATRERREPLLLVVVVQTFRRVRFTRASLLKTCTNERKIQSLFVIFKFIKIQKRKKKEGRKKNNDRVILLSASRWTTQGLLDICITVYCISLRPLLLYWSIPGNI